MTDTRFIEESFPVKEISEISAREKNVRAGNISGLHVWWARRPLAASRTTAYAALTPAVEDIDSWQKQRNFIIELSRWENARNRRIIDLARQTILDANGGNAPRVLDPFSGGGSYPLEALRLGCESYANDYNPVAVILLKATLEYPQRFGNKRQSKITSEELRLGEAINRDSLADEVSRWGTWVNERAREELAVCYPVDEDGAKPIAYIWVRTLPCQNPSCAAEIPLIRQFWLSNKRGKQVALALDTTARVPQFYIVGDGYRAWPEGFDPSIGTVSQAVVTCPCCGSALDSRTVRRLFLEKRNGERMAAVVSRFSDRRGKFYRSATSKDEQIYAETISRLQAKRDRLVLEWGLDPIPDEPIPTTELRRISIPLYGFDTWSAMFNERQKLVLAVFTEHIRNVYEEIVHDEPIAGFATAVVTYLALALNRLMTRSSSFSVWHRQTEGVEKIFALQALPMQWEYAESNVLNDDTVSGFTQNVDTIVDVIRFLSESGNPAVITNQSATQLTYPDNYFDAVLTDPPYYDNVAYSHLSDFFYVLLKRSLGHLHPDLFSTPLTPKSQEIVQDRKHSRSKSPKTKQYFEEMLTKALKEVRRVLKPDGVSIIVYAHKSTDGWETLLNSLLDSGLIVTGAWPLNTELGSRLVARDTAALASSIYIVARKMERKPTGFYNDVREEMRQHLNRKLHRLWEEGIGGADFFIAAIGSAIEVFGKYEQVMDFEGNIVRADRMLQEVQTIATDYAVHQILQNGFSGEVSELTRFYVLWRWNYGDAKVPFDEARKLAQSCGVDLNREWKRAGSFVKQQKDVVRVLGPQNRKADDLENTTELVDTLHRVLLLWEKGKRDTMIETLAHSPTGRSEAFYRVAQAISQTLPVDNKEKKLLDGFLAGRERVQDDVNNSAGQQRLL